MGQIKNISELLPDEPIKDPFEDEIHFNNTVREYVVSSSYQHRLGCKWPSP